MEDEGLNKKSYTKVIDYIKKQILIGELKVGEKLPAERELAQILGISRNSVREAIRSLDIMGMITSHHGAGNYITGNFENNLVESMSMMFLLHQINYEQISELRLGLEMQALLLAIDNISEEEIDELKDIISKLENDTEENNVILDKKLHYNIAYASKNKLIIEILNALSEVMDIFIKDLRKEILSKDDSRRLLNDAHNKMVKSLITKDKALAFESINKHFNVVDEKLFEMSKRMRNLGVGILEMLICRGLFKK